MESCQTDVIMFTDIDSLLDTRLGAVSMFDPDVATEMLKHGWQKRQTDRWQSKQTSFTYDEYRELYYRKTLDVLRASGPTELVKMLFSIVRENEVTAADINRGGKHKLIVNIDLYPFSKDEVTELEVALLELMPFFTEIKIVRHALKYLTIDALKRYGVNYYISYDAMRWFRIHNDELVGNRHLWLTVLAPGLREQEWAELEDGEELKKLSEGMDPFTAMEFQLSMHVNARFVDVKYFSLIEIGHKEEG